MMRLRWRYWHVRALALLKGLDYSMLGGFRDGHDHDVLVHDPRGKCIASSGFTNSILLHTEKWNPLNKRGRCLHTSNNPRTRPNWSICANSSNSCELVRTRPNWSICASGDISALIISGRNGRCRPVFSDGRQTSAGRYLRTKSHGHHDGRTGTTIDDRSTGEEASVPQLHQRQGQVHFCFVGRRIMQKM